MRRGRTVQACLLCTSPDTNAIEEVQNCSDPVLPCIRNAAAPYSLDAINIQIGALEDFMMKRRDVGMDGKEMQKAISMVQQIDQHVGQLMKLLK